MDSGMETQRHRASDSSSSERKSEGTFGAYTAAPARERAAVPWMIAGALVAIVLLLLVFAGRRHGPPNAAQILPLDPYAQNLIVSDLAMSESTSLSGGKSTFLDGRIRNAGPRTVTAVTVQVLFANEEGMPPRIETVPLMLIRTREPYVDTGPVSTAPLKTGDSREFRLIFESLPANWNMQLPEMRVTSVRSR